MGYVAISEAEKRLFLRAALECFAMRKESIVHLDLGKCGQCRWMQNIAVQYQNQEWEICSRTQKEDNNTQ